MNKILMFIRPQIEFLNSAFWQWGAWEFSSFDDFLENYLELVNWYKIVYTLETELNIDIDIIPIGKEVIIDFLKYLSLNNIDNIELEEYRLNSSLPEIVLRLYQRYRELRPGPHASLIDFIINKIIRKYGFNVNFKPTPWVIKKDIIKKLIEYYKPYNEALISKIKEEEYKKRILKNPKWWYVEAYQEREFKPITGDIDKIELEIFCVMLLKALKDGFCKE